MTETNNLSFVAFISELRALWGRGNTEGTSHWHSVRTCLGKLMKDIELQAASSNWPGKRGEELILYHDADYGFFVGGLVRPHQHDARPHDHAHTWTAYGVLFGREKTTLFDDFRVRAVQKTIPKIMNKSSKISLEKGDGLIMKKNIQKLINS